VIAGDTVGDPDEQRAIGEPLAALDEAARRASDLPLIDGVLACETGSVEIEHHADAARDAYLRDHRAGGNAVLPGVVMLELIAETASVALGGQRVDTIEQMMIDQSFRLPPDGRGSVRALAHVDGDAVVVRLVAAQADRHGRVIDGGRVIAHGRARRAIALPPLPAWPEVTGRIVPFRYKTAAELEPNRVVHGPTLHALLDTIRGDDAWHASRLRSLPAEALREGKTGTWLVPAPLLDGCLATCGDLLKSARGIAGLPRGFGRVTLYNVPNLHEECRALVHQLRSDEREVHFDFAVWGADRRLLFVVDDYIWRSFDRGGRTTIGPFT
jgi:hypothetical protein